MNIQEGWYFIYTTKTENSVGVDFFGSMVYLQHTTQKYPSNIHNNGNDGRKKGWPQQSWWQ